MAVSYKKLWKLLIDKDIKKKDLIEKAKISPATVTKMGKMDMLPLKYSSRSAQRWIAKLTTLWKLFLLRNNFTCANLMSRFWRLFNAVKYES